MHCIKIDTVVCHRYLLYTNIPRDIADTAVNQFTTTVKVKVNVT